MRPTRLATSAAITVLGTLVIAAIGYAGASREVRGQMAAHQEPKPIITPAPIAKPAPQPVLFPSPARPGRLFVWDADMVDVNAGWLLLTDCNSEASAPCHYSVERTQDAGSSWSDPVVVGPQFSPQDGDAPRNIRFLDRSDGFVYGHANAFVTHDGGRSWADTGLQGEIVAISAFETTVWAVTRPCAKAVSCAYDVRASHDAGRTWSLVHQLSPLTSPDALVAFGNGAIVSTIPTGNVEWTSDQGMTWQKAKSPCVADQFRGDATTADGVEVWVLCQAYPDGSGAINDATPFMTRDGGKTWSQRDIPGILPGWLATPAPTTALTDAKASLILSNDSGRTWVGVGQGAGPFAPARFASRSFGWTVDSARDAWFTDDGGSNWFEWGSLPSTRP